MKLPPLLFSELSSPYTWITPPDEVGDTLLAEGWSHGVSQRARRCLIGQTVDWTITHQDTGSKPLLGATLKDESATRCMR